MDDSFGVIFNLKSQRFSPMFSHKSHVFLLFAFRAMTHFEEILYMMRFKSILPSFIFEFPSVSTPFVETTMY